VVENDLNSKNNRKYVRIPKRYGQSRKDVCPFCGKNALTINKQHIPVCNNHKTSTLDEMKCICGEILELKSGKYGIYFTCIDCGNINSLKVFETNKVENSKDSPQKRRETFREKRKRRNVFEPPETVTSNDPRYFS